MSMPNRIHYRSAPNYRTPCNILEPASARSMRKVTFISLPLESGSLLENVAYADQQASEALRLHGFSDDIYILVTPGSFAGS